MKFFILTLCLFSLSSWSESTPLTATEQRQLVQEVQSLKQRVEALESKSGSAGTDEETKKMLQTLQKGKSFQEAQQKALDELD
jgi:predicted  nucleic acid-binding Zn-ribbon protein